MQGSPFDVLFIGLLAELPAILDNFFTSITSDYIGEVVTPSYGPNDAVDSPKSSQTSGQQH